MCQGCGGTTYNAEMGVVTTCDNGNLFTLWRGITGQYPKIYWTATEYSTEKAYYYNYDSNRFDTYPKAEASCYTLPVLAF